MANKNKIIGFDMDGVLLDHTQNKLRVVKALGWELKPEQTVSEVLKKILPESQYHQMQITLYNDPKFFMRASLVKDVKNMLRKVKANYSYFLISRRKNPEFAIKALKSKNLWPEFFNKKNTLISL